MCEETQRMGWAWKSLITYKMYTTMLGSLTQSLLSPQKVKCDHMGELKHRLKIKTTQCILIVPWMWSRASRLSYCFMLPSTNIGPGIRETLHWTEQIRKNYMQVKKTCVKKTTGTASLVAYTYIVKCIHDIVWSRESIEPYIYQWWRLLGKPCD